MILGESGWKDGVFFTSNSCNFNYHYHNIQQNNHNNHALQVVQPRIRLLTVNLWMNGGWMDGWVFGWMRKWLERCSGVCLYRQTQRWIGDNDYSLSWLQILLAHHGTISQRQLICRASRRLHGLRGEKQKGRRGKGEKVQRLKDMRENDWTFYIPVVIFSLCFSLYLLLNTNCDKNPL